jgi:ABC-type glycerol-3-phosphate transport system substrate-binding protein
MAISNETIQANREVRNYYTKKIEAFKSVEPNIAVELKTTSGPNTDVSEIGWFDVQDSGSDELAQALDLSPFIEREANFDRTDFYPGLLDAFTRDGKLLALPTGVNPFVLYYNQDLFDKHSLPYPSPNLTWDEFKTLAMQLRDPETGSYGYLPMENYTDAIFFAFQHGATLLSGNQPQVDSIEAIQALEWYATLYSDLGAAPTAERLQSEFGDRGVYAAIYTGFAGMWISDLAQLSRFNDDRTQFKVGIAPLPKDQTSFSVAQFQGLVISTQTKYPDAAWRWVRFLSGQTQPWSLPARRSIAESEQFSAEFGKDQAEIARIVVENARLITSFDMNMFQPVMEAYLTATAQTVDGMIPAADTLREAQLKLSP